MKAKEYAKMYYESESLETLAKIGTMFLEETKTILISRNCKTPEASASVFKELDQKWMAFAREVDGIKPDGYRSLVKFQWEEVYHFLGWD